MMEQDDEIKSGCLLFPPAGGNMFSKFPKKVKYTITIIGINLCNSI